MQDQGAPGKDKGNTDRIDKQLGSLCYALLPPAGCKRSVLKQERSLEEEDVGKDPV